MIPISEATDDSFGTNGGVKEATDWAEDVLTDFKSALAKLENLALDDSRDSKKTALAHFVDRLVSVFDDAERPYIEVADALIKLQGSNLSSSRPVTARSLEYHDMRFNRLVSVVNKIVDSRKVLSADKEITKELEALTPPTSSDKS
jgi:hypothetical protein